MNESEENQADKPYEATRRKLEDARQKGEIVRSQDVVNLVVLVMFLIAVHVMFGGVMSRIILDIMRFLENAIAARASLDGAGNLTVVLGWLHPLVGIIFVLPFVVVLSGLIGTKQLLFTGDKLKPKLNRISLIANAKKKYGWSGLFEFAKNFLKFAVFAGILGLFVFDSDRLFQIAVLRGKHMALANLYEVAVRWLWFTLVAYIAFAGLDVLWQMHEHAKKNRMSHKEMKDEHKTEEGDENIRQQRRAKAEDIATNRMLLDVPKSAVVITNPTHFAVALQWSGEDNTVPKCVARGTDETARKIREVAISSGVPLYNDPPTARALYAQVKVGTIIDEDHYKAVAAAIGYARRIQNMARK